MTKQTKVGLLIGMGVILLIGIILTDHLAVTQKHPAAMFTDYGPNAQDGLTPPTVLRTNPRPTRYKVGVPTHTSPTASKKTPGKLLHPAVTASVSNVKFAQPVVELPTYQPDIDARRPRPKPQPLKTRSSPHNQPAPPTEHKRPPKPVIHVVKEGDNLWEIAQRYYGDGHYWKTIRDANPKYVTTDGNVRPKVDLCIPNKAGLIRTPKSGPTSPRLALELSQPHHTPSSPTITVAAGDTLSSIAHHVYGDSNRWQQIYIANRDKLTDPDHLSAGQNLKIPQ